MEENSKNKTKVVSYFTTLILSFVTAINSVSAQELSIETPTIKQITPSKLQQLFNEKELSLLLSSIFSQKEKVIYLISIPYTLQCPYEYHSAEVEILFYSDSNQTQNRDPADVNILGVIPNHRLREINRSQKTNFTLSLEQLFSEVGIENSMDYKISERDISVEIKDSEVKWFFQQFQEETIPCGTNQLIGVVEAPIFKSVPKIAISSQCIVYQKTGFWQGLWKKLWGNDKESCNSQERLVDIPYQHLNFYQNARGELTTSQQKNLWIFEDQKGRDVSIHIICANHTTTVNGISCPDSGLKSATLKVYDPNGREIVPDSSDNVNIDWGRGQVFLSINNLPLSGQYTVEVLGVGANTGQYQILLTRILK